MIISAALCGCGDARETARQDVPSASTTHPSHHVTVASLVPAATDLLLGMGANDHLVAVSNYDVDRPGVTGLPRVGDYQTVDWERLQSLHPDILIIFQSPERVPAGMKEQAAALHIRLENARTETLDDLYRELHHLGTLVDEPQLAAAAEQKLRDRLDAVRRRVAGKPRVATLIVRDEKAEGVVGRNTFIDELLTIAGGTNVIETSGWPDIDRERLLALKPQAIIQLLSAAPPQVEAEARSVWQGLESVPAVRNGRVYLINEWYTQQPGYHVADLAERMAEALHGAKAGEGSKLQ